MEIIIVLLIVVFIISIIAYFIYPILHEKPKIKLPAPSTTVMDYTANSLQLNKTDNFKKVLSKVVDDESYLTEQIETNHRNKWIDETINKLNNYQSLSDLLILKMPTEIYYGDLLQCFEWKFKRLSVLLRDKFECNDCKIRKVNNHVHHTYYLQNKLPWDIKDEALETLCHKCHSERHQKSTIPVFRIQSDKFIEISRENPSCFRCGGTGYLAQFSHVENGVCFKCRGNLVGRTVFSNILNITYRNLNSYNETFLRNKYKSKLNTITEKEFLEKIPNFESYIPVKSQISSANDYHVYSDNYTDDLPF